VRGKRTLPRDLSCTEDPSLPALRAGFGRGGGTQARSAEYRRGWASLFPSPLLSSSAAEVGAAAPPTDVDTTGSSSGYDPQPVTTAPEDWSQNPYVQVEGGFLAGLSLGVVPFGGVGQQLLDAGGVLPHGTPEARRGLAVGLIVGGLISLAGGLTGEVAGGIATVTGIGAAVGVPAIAVSTTLVVGGVGNIAAGIRGLMTTGSGSAGPKGAVPTAGKGAPPGTSGGPRAEMKFTQEGKADVRAANRAANNGKLTCESCGRNDLVDPKRAMGGQPRPTNEGQVDHIIPRAQGGDGSPSNGQVLCPTCNATKSDKLP
jgi:hypothetical protein